MISGVTMSADQFQDDIKFLLSFAPAETPEQVEPSLSPMFYITGSYEGDRKIAAKIAEIRKRHGIEVGEIEDDNDYAEDRDDGQF